MSTASATDTWLSCYENAKSKLIQEFSQEKQLWIGELSSSALSTAVATYTLKHYNPDKYSREINLGYDWLTKHQNTDGSYGDTTESPGNLSTTLLAWAAFSNMDSPVANQTAAWIKNYCGSLESNEIINGLDKIYNEDRSFSAPIMTMLAISGRLGNPTKAWKSIPQLPFELASMPRSFFRLLKLDVVSYAIPALIAIGLSKHTKSPSKILPLKLLRNSLGDKVLNFLTRIQPENGGFLEATPLTAFVALNLSECGLRDHPVVTKCIDFLKASQRTDGSWPIDTNLSTWVSTLSISALGPKPFLDKQIDSAKVRESLLKQQLKTIHPYTGAKPGGWAWTPLAGAVPDADDTAGALIALKKLPGSQASDRLAAEKGIEWLLQIQNKDGGMPTFCRGWGKLPFDKSCPDITAHGIRALGIWHNEMSHDLQNKIASAIKKMENYLITSQQEDGSWHPLWFGNQKAEGQVNKCFGTSQVLIALNDEQQNNQLKNAINKAREWLIQAQNSDGSWGGARNIEGSIEETALAIQALCEQKSQKTDSFDKALNWLQQHTKNGTVFKKSPIGLYFASLWYDEKLYPIIFTVGALRKRLEQLKQLKN